MASEVVLSKIPMVALSAVLTTDEFDLVARDTAGWEVHGALPQGFPELRLDRGSPKHQQYSRS